MIFRKSDSSAISPSFYRRFPSETNLGTGDPFAASSAIEFYLIKLSWLEGQHRKKISYAEFARRAGFSARSYPREVAIGRRRLTQESVIKFSKALKLTAPERLFFGLLVERDAFKRKNNFKKFEVVDRHIQKIRQKQGRGRTPSIAQVVPPPSTRWAEIYAALGDPELGANRAEIAARTRIAERELGKDLDLLVEMDVVEKLGNHRFRAKNFHLLFNDPHHQLDGLTFFKQALTAVGQRVDDGFKKSESTFFRSTVVSIDSQRLKELKRLLETVINDFINECEDPVGDRIQRLVISWD